MAPACRVGGASTISRRNGGGARSTCCSVALPKLFTDRAVAVRVPGGTSTVTRTWPEPSAITGPKLRSATCTVTWAPGSVRNAGLAGARSGSESSCCAGRPGQVLGGGGSSATSRATCGKRPEGSS